MPNESETGLKLAPSSPRTVEQEAPEEIAEAVKGISTNDGEVLLFNLHVDTESGDEIVFPSSEDELPDDYAKLLYRMSSTVPAHLISVAQSMGALQRLVLSRRSGGHQIYGSRCGGLGNL